MEVQELACKALIANVRYRLSPLLIDNRGTLIQRLTKALDTTEFGWRDDGVDVFTTDSHDMFRLSGRDLVASCEHFADLAETAARIKVFVEEGIDALGVERASFLGVRTFWVAPTDDFDGLRDVLLDSIGSGASTVADLAGKRPTDAGWVLEFHGTDPRISVRMGPMLSEQAIQQIFRVEDPELYPPQFLFLDVDRVLADDEIPAADLVDRLTRAIEHNLALAEKFGRHFTSLGT